MEMLKQSAVFTEISAEEAANINGAWGGHYYHRPIYCYYPVYPSGGSGSSSSSPNVNQSVNVNVVID